MDFSFCFDNHAGVGRESLYDIVDAIVGQLIDLGHRVHHHDGALRPDRINVVVEGFTDHNIEAMRVLKMPGTMDPIIHDGRTWSVKEAGIPLVIIATERPGRPGFNNVKAWEMVTRQRNFPAAAREATAVWCLVPGVEKWAGQWCAGSADLELGWSRCREDAMRGKFGADDNALYDFSFYGSLTPRRRNLIRQIEKRGYLVMTSEKNTLAFREGIGIATKDDLSAMTNVHNRSGFLDITSRNRMIAGSKIVLGIHQYPGWSLVSNSRFSTALCMGRPVVNEPPPRNIDTPWRKVGIFSANVGSFVDEAIAALDHWKQLRDHQVAMARQMFGPQCMGEVLKRTLRDFLDREAA
jgi:hypothetical protein